jgi:hypothetical protein
VYLVQVSLLLISQQGFRYFSGIGPCFSLAGGLCKFYANAEGKRPIQRQPLIVQYKHQANPLLSMLHVLISGNEKNMQLTLLNQRKLELTARNTLFFKSLEHLKIFLNGPVLYLCLKLTIS